MIGSAAELFRALAWRVMPDAMCGRSRDALAHGCVPGPAVSAASIREGERLGGGARARPRQGAQEVEEEGKTMRVIEDIRRAVVRNRAVRKSIEARRAKALRRQLRGRR